MFLSVCPVYFFSGSTDKAEMCNNEPSLLDQPVLLYPTFISITLFYLTGQPQLADGAVNFIYLKLNKFI